MSGDLLGFGGPPSVEQGDGVIDGDDANHGLDNGHSLLDGPGETSKEARNGGIASSDGFDPIHEAVAPLSDAPSDLFDGPLQAVESEALVNGSSLAGNTSTSDSEAGLQMHGSTNLLDFSETRVPSNAVAEDLVVPDLLGGQTQLDTQQHLSQPQNVPFDIWSAPPESSDDTLGNVPTRDSFAPDPSVKEIDLLAMGGQDDPGPTLSSSQNIEHQDSLSALVSPSKPQQNSLTSPADQSSSVAIDTPVSSKAEVSLVATETTESIAIRDTISNATKMSTTGAVLDSNDIGDSTQMAPPNATSSSDMMGITNDASHGSESVSASPSAASKLIPGENASESSDSSVCQVDPATTFAAKSSSSPVGDNAANPTSLANGVTTMREQPQPSPLVSLAPENSADIQLPKQVEWLQNELRAAQTLIIKLQQHGEDEEKLKESAFVVELQASLQNEMNLRSDAEKSARLAKIEYDKVEEEFTAFKEDTEYKIDSLKRDLEVLSQEKSDMQKELETIRDERDEQARKEMALTTRLNAAKKKEALKSNAAEHYEDQVDQLERQVSEYKEQLETVKEERSQLQMELVEWKNYAERRTKQLEAALSDEKKLNDERKRKMKGFVEAKTEEVRAAKADNVSLQTELDQTAHSLKELNQRYKQLHAQWVQSQTRNRELQRDVTKMKMDSEKMHKVGGTLEARLSRSAQESEDHKNKRLQAKHELMSVLSQLEAERSVNNRLRESIKMTFTPKALSQQQTIQETLEDFEGALQKLSTRLGRPVPPPTSSVNDLALDALNEDDGTFGTASNGELADDDESKSGGNTLSDIHTNRVLQKLENETKRVSQSIVTLSTSVERMHAMLEGGGTRNCVGALHSMLMSSRSSEETRSITGKSRMAPTRNGPRYGQISGSMT